MPTYNAPLDNIRFVLHDVFNVSELAELPGYEEATPDMIDAIIGEGAKVCEEVLFPLNQSGDNEGCHFEDGVVTAPKGFKEAYQSYIEMGWTGMVSDPVYGGQGLPQIVQVVMEELICSANMSFGMYPGLSKGAYDAVYLHGTDYLKQTYLPKLVEGTWSGTMCLTEPHCGTDLGLIKTKAEPAPEIKSDGDNVYKISGTKIFISAGEHDLTENILHLVLAKLPDAPDGIKGISLFLVPKFKVNADGTLGERNNVACGSIEHKMGIHGNSTCVMNFDNAQGHLVGEKHKGMKAMFTMMNMARLAVGMQGLGLAEVSYQNALSYAKDRLQGRSLTGVKQPEKPADSLLVHPDVRKNLLTMKSITEGCRALAYWIGIQEDIAQRHPDEQRKQEAHDLVTLLTPVIKSYLTDAGFDITNIGVQIYGGHGFIKEWGMEQYVRDARITQLYEGTNGIQALDLVGRKLGQNMGRLLRRFFHPVQNFLEENMEHEALKDVIPIYYKAFSKLQQASLFIAQKGIKNPDEAGAAATDYQRIFAIIAIGYMWLLMAKTAHEKIQSGEGDVAFYKSKLKTAKFFFERILPEHYSRYHAMLTGSETMMSFTEDEF
ncbi:MAG: acyl-CoA dehydrogenase C-terminal domain-containing protein [Gammaproteobacteria bacterium]|nr:acyl-CoA dehydrogenase C-terminal domain-containing protein [Gammaproteobacteria bacterium]